MRSYDRNSSFFCKKCKVGIAKTKYFSYLCSVFSLFWKNMEKNVPEIEPIIDVDELLAPFFRIHDFLVAHSSMPIRRLLMDEINWDDRLIAIKGGRGVGKTDFLLARAKEIETAWRNQPEPEYKGRRPRKSIKDIRPCL